MCPRGIKAIDSKPWAEQHCPLCWVLISVISHTQLIVIQNSSADGLL